MAATGTSLFHSNLYPLFHRDSTSLSLGKLISTPISISISTWRLAEQAPTPATKLRMLQKRGEVEAVAAAMYEDPVVGRKSLKEYLERSKELIIKSDGGPPRWFTPLECGPPSINSPLLLFLPELVKLVERTIRSQNHLSPNMPIYLVGGCLALAVAACNPDIDLVLILANPATSFSHSQLQLFMTLLDIVPDLLPRGLPNMLRLMTGDPLRMMMDSLLEGLSLQQTVGELSQDLLAISSYLSILPDVYPRETLGWKLQMLKSASSVSNSRLHAVKAQTLILLSERDQLLPSQDEGEKLRRALPKCEIRKFNESSHFLFLEDSIDLVTIIKGAGFYRRGKCKDYVSDYMPPTPTEFINIYAESRWINAVTSPVMLSTLEDGKIVRGLAGIPSEGPVLLVGYHMLLGLEVVPLFDTLRMMGAVPVSGINFYKLLSSKSHVLLYPGGMREDLHRKGEEYKLIWPEQSEFVRMAARFGAKIIPFGAVGEDDISELVFYYNDLMKIPHFKAEIRELTNEAVKLRTNDYGEVANQDVHFPGILSKFPGRLYYYFGKPIKTEGRGLELRDRDKSHEFYLQVKTEVQRCIGYLKEKRENDPYRNLLSRLIYQTTHGFSAEVPTFELSVFRKR